jgi:hypothetical protein
MQQSGNTTALFYYNGNTVKMLCKRMHPNALVMQEEAAEHEPSAFLHPPPWLLLFFKEEKDILKRIKAATSNTYVESELERLQHQGYCMDPLTHPEHWRRLAAPIRDHTDNIVAALVLGGNPYTIPQDSIEPLAHLLKTEATQFTRQLSQWHSS